MKDAVCSLHRLGQSPEAGHGHDSDQQDADPESKTESFSDFPVLEHDVAPMLLSVSFCRLPAMRVVELTIAYRNGEAIGSG
jgi:hypothetical protein